jgi:hypothetical protein
MSTIPLVVPPEFYRRPQTGKSDAEKMQARGEEDGTLRMVITVDETGRRIRKFFGDPEACWGPFKQPTRRVTGFRTQFR